MATLKPSLKSILATAAGWTIGVGGGCGGKAPDTWLEVAQWLARLFPPIQAVWPLTALLRNQSESATQAQSSEYRDLASRIDSPFSALSAPIDLSPLSDSLLSYIVGSRGPLEGNAASRLKRIIASHTILQ